MRKAQVTRTTKETSIELEIDLDGQGLAEVSTGVGFADHMLTLLAFWAGFDLSVACQGDLEVNTCRAFFTNAFGVQRWEQHVIKRGRKYGDS